MLDLRIGNALEGLVIAGVLVLLFYLIAAVIKRFLGPSIDSRTYYLVAVVIGFLVHRSVPAFWSSAPPPTSPVVAFANAATTFGLDSPFIAPPEERMEDFVAQLQRSIQSLPHHDRDRVNTAIGFLTFAVIADLSEKEPKAADATDSDIAAKSLTRLYRFAQRNGKSMTLRKYVDLAEEFRRQKPQWWQQFQSANRK